MVGKKRTCEEKMALEDAERRSKSYHGVHELDAALQLWPGVTVLTEQQPADGLLLT